MYAICKSNIKEVKKTMKIKQNSIKIFQISLLLIGIGILLSFGINTTSAANSSSVYVSTNGNDNWNGLNSTYTSGLNGPKATISNATGTVQSKGTVHVASGTYNENNIQINTNMTIIGENQKNTIINGQQSGNPIFTIISGVNVKIINLTLTNGTTNYYGGAIYNNGESLDLTNSTITDNYAAEGGAIYNDGTLTATNDTFNNNTSGDEGGAISNDGTLTATNDEFNNNTSGGAGGAIYNSGTLTATNDTFNNNSAYFGGAIYNSGTISETNDTFNNNSISSSYGGAIYNQGNLTETNDTFNNNTATTGGGGAIANSGILTTNHDTFNNNSAYDYGGAIKNFGTITSTNDTFNNNTINSGGGAIFNSGALTVTNDTFNKNIASDYGIGGAIINFGTLTINNSTFTKNTAINGGGAIFNQGNLNVENSTFTKNTAIDGGAIQNSGALDVEESSFINNSADVGNAFYIVLSKKGFSIDLHFNRIVGNATSVELYSEGNREVNATFNWWGSNNPGNVINGTNIIYNPWIILTVTANPQTINKGDNSTVTADLLHDNEDNYLDPVNGHVPDGILINFSSDGLGTLSPTTNTTTNGSTNAIYTAHSVGVSEVSTTVDEQTITTPITINAISTTITVNPAHNYAGQNITLTSQITEINGIPVNDGIVIYIVNGNNLGTATVNNGIATLNWTIPNNWNKNIYTITATYDGTGTNYINSTNTSKLTVDTIPTHLIFKNVTGLDNLTLALKATLSDVYGNLLADQKVFFNVNGRIYSTISNYNGIASINYIPIGVGNYNVTVNYPGNNNYTSSEDSGLLIVNPSAYLYLMIGSSDKNPKLGGIFTITYKLGNKGPDNATNVTTRIPLPSDFILSNIAGNGNWTYNKITNTITWTLTNVTLGDPYLYITGKLNKSGVYVFGSNITSETYNPNNQGVTPITITSTEPKPVNPVNPKKPINPVNPKKPVNPVNPVSNNTTTKLIADTTTIPMQHTGVPITELVLAILSIIGGTAISRRK